MKCRIRTGKALKAAIGNYVNEFGVRFLLSKGLERARAEIIMLLIAKIVAH